MPKFNNVVAVEDTITRLVPVRLGRPEPVGDVLPVFDGGEALPESDGFDEGHPISPEEQSALDWEETRARLDQLEQEEWENETEVQAVGIVDKGFTNEPPAKPEGTTTHRCPVFPCNWYLDVPPVTDDVMSLLGGVSVAKLEQAQEVEQYLFSHLSEHTVVEWVAALRQAQDTAAKAIERIPYAGIQAGYAPLTFPANSTGTVTTPGVTPGPAQRDPARAAAVAALDARLGRGTNATPRSPEEAAEIDEALRARRAARRAQPPPTPYDLTPRYSADPEFGGTVGIKR
jgi:hypothetical protein